MELFRDKSNIKLPPNPKNVTQYQCTTNIKEVTSHRKGMNDLREHDFKATTEIIAKRIVKKQVELGKMGTPKRKSVNFCDKPQIAVKMNNVVVQRILRIQMQEEAKQEKSMDMLHFKPENTYTLSSTPTRTSSFQSISTLPSSVSSKQNFVTPRSISRTSLSSSKSMRPSNVQTKKSLELPRFQLSTNHGTRVKVENKGIQSNIVNDLAKTLGNQTHFEEFLKGSSVQVTHMSKMAGKKLQTRLYKKTDVETDPIAFRNPSKATNTNIYYNGSRMDHHTQLFEFMSDGDMFCLEWINKHLFPVNLNPFSVIVDQKLRDASELGTKSTLFSESKTLRNFQQIIEKPCCPFK